MSRIASVDFVRTVAIAAVIVIHTSPFESLAMPIGEELDTATFVNQVARFAVPFFFVVSGFFWAHKFTDEKHLIAPTAKMLRRTAFIWIFWSAVYLLPVNIIEALGYGTFGPLKVIYWNVANAINRPIITIFEGTKVHLWFLVSLLQSVVISAVLLRFNFRKTLIVVAAILYVIGLAGKTYVDTPFGFRADFNFRDGPFCSLAPFVTGYLLQRQGPNASWFYKGIFLTSVGAVMHFAELLTIHRIWGTTMIQDYDVGTYFMGVGVALIALSGSKYLNFSMMASVGPLVLGIYASHYVFVDMLKPLDQKLSGISMWGVAYVIAVFFLSYLLTRLFSKYRLTKMFVV